MSIALGREDVGPKTRAQDWRTPEGVYRIDAPARPGRFHLFIPINYPAPADARRALDEGRLSLVDYEAIVEAHDQERSPPRDTPLGGDLGFHGEGERWRGESQYHDWTYGCIAVTDEQIEFLAERVEVGVPVRIHPSGMPTD